MRDLDDPLLYTFTCIQFDFIAFTIIIFPPRIKKPIFYCQLINNYLLSFTLQFSLHFRSIGNWKSKIALSAL